MDQGQAKLIIQNAVESTSSRWVQYAESWKNIDTIFILRGYEQQGFQLFKMRPVLEDFCILSIDSLGKILQRYSCPRKYDRELVGSLTSEFYTSARNGDIGKEAQLFEKAVRQFLERRMGNTGRKFWILLYHLLQACAFLRQNHSSSFATYIISKYERFSNRHHISEHEFLNMSVSEWEYFLKRAKPWTELKGIGPNVFDFLFGDIVEAHFVENSYKWDSSNEHFLRVTGISHLIEPFDREATVHFLKRLGIPYSLREINKGIYTYCSLTERENYGFCRDRAKCNKCSVINICDKRL
ncbi:MAG: hypothetical protein KGZ75_14645 [Syntrophomonadaceae bacterium]|nr:hypothetical protein [Syntrophomonadaceae bacterium]